jgi:hypothetical protein
MLTAQEVIPMSEPRREQPRRLDPDDIALAAEIQSLQGEEMPVDQDAFLEPDEIEAQRTLTRTELDAGYTAPATDEGGAARLDGLALDDLREGETDDPGVATQEGLTYVPPSDPPFRIDPDDPEGIAVAAGPGTSALDEPYDPDHVGDPLPDEAELTARIREAIAADAATTAYADRLVIGTRGSTAVVRGIVDDIDDSDAIAAVIERVEGIDEVVDETELADG